MGYLNWHISVRLLTVSVKIHIKVLNKLQQWQLVSSIIIRCYIVHLRILNRPDAATAEISTKGSISSIPHRNVFSINTHRQHVLFSEHVSLQTVQLIIIYSFGNEHSVSASQSILMTKRLAKLLRLLRTNMNVQITETGSSAQNDQETASAEIPWRMRA